MTGESKTRRPHGLGRGLSALLGEVGRETPVDEGGGAAPHNVIRSIQTIEVGLIKPHPDQPRRHFDESALGELAESIARRGVIQPIVVRPHEGGYQIVAGERRWRAAQKAQLHRIPAIVRDFDDAETLEIALVENIQREDLNPIEEAEAFRKLTAEYGHSQEALGRLVGKSRSHIANLMRLLELPERVQQAVMEGRLTMGHARALVGAEDADALARAIEARGLSVRETERLVRGAKGRGDTTRPRTAAGKDADITALEHHLSDLLGLRVDIQHKGGPGAMTLSYSTLDQLDMLCQRLSDEKI